MIIIRGKMSTPVTWGLPTSLNGCQYVKSSPSVLLLSLDGLRFRYKKDRQVPSRGPRECGCSSQTQSTLSFSPPPSVPLVFLGSDLRCHGRSMSHFPSTQYVHFRVGRRGFLVFFVPKSPVLKNRREIEVGRPPEKKRKKPGVKGVVY